MNKDGINTDECDTTSIKMIMEHHCSCSLTFLRNIYCNIRSSNRVVMNKDCTNADDWDTISKMLMEHFDLVLV